MDIRPAISDKREPVVLSVAFSENTTRFICGMEDGLRIFRSKDCIRTRKYTRANGRGIAIAETVDDDVHVAIVEGGRHPNSAVNKFEFWDVEIEKQLHQLDAYEDILGLRLTDKYLLIILDGRVVCVDNAWSKVQGRVIPGIVRGVYQTGANPHALCCLSGDSMVVPGLTPGQAQITSLIDKSKRIIPAHNSALKAMALSKDGKLLATAGEQGTMIRIYSIETSKPLHEFRRGVESAHIYGLAFSPNNHFVASTSDKGTLHIYDLRPKPVEEARSTPVGQRRGSYSRPTAIQRARPGSVDFDNISIPSVSSSPKTAAGFYGPPPDLAHTPPVAGPSALSAMARFPGVPRAFSDLRSMAKITYHVGRDPPNWQGQEASTTTTFPSGKTGKVKNPNTAVPGRPDGRPPKGVVAWDPEGADRKLWVVSGGADAIWEVFELVQEEGAHSLKIVKAGFRKYLTRQYPEEE